MKDVIRGVNQVSDQPSIFFSMVVMGYFMIWVAGFQVDKTLQFIGIENESRPANQNPDLVKCIGFCVLTLIYLWVDLIIIRVLVGWIKQFLKKWEKERQRAKAAMLKQAALLNLDDGPDEEAILIRKNPPRTCRPY